MFARRSDIPLDKDAHSQFLPWLIAFMVFLSVLAVAGMLTLELAARKWDQGISGTLSVQIIPAENRRADELHLREALNILARSSEIARYETLSEKSLLKLLEPWLGSNIQTGDLPVPQIIEVELKPGTGLDASGLTKRLSARIPGVVVDDYQIWLQKFLRLIRTIEAVATAVLFFIALATIGTVVFTTRTGLAIHREAIEVLHLIGAEDRYVASQFAGRALILGLKGGLFGLLLAAPTVFAIAYLARSMDDTVMPDLTFTIWHWGTLAGLAGAVAIIAMMSAYFTVLRMLNKML